MENRLIALKLFLDELGIKQKIATLDDRKRVQKAVYLGQLSGADLGYRFSWYLLGPYSTSLSKDYYSLAETIVSRECHCEDMELRGSVKKQLQTMKPLLKAPEGEPLSQEDWLELLASFHFLVKASRYNKEKIKETFQREKPHLLNYLELAEATLKAKKLIS